MVRMSESERSELWDRWEAGESQRSICLRICRCLVTQSVLERKCGDDHPEFGTNFVELSADT